MIPESVSILRRIKVDNKIKCLFYFILGLVGLLIPNAVAMVIGGWLIFIGFLHLILDENKNER